MKSYAMVFSPVDAAGTDSSVRAWNYELHGGDDTALPAGCPEVWEAGWVGSTGPGIEQDQWPRSTFTGLPMQHIFTVRLPGEYLPDAQKYPGVVAFSFFAGDGQFAEDEATEGVANAASDDPFEVQYAQARAHPYQLLLRDILDAEFAVLYLSEEEFSSRTEPPQDVRRPGEHRGEEESFSAWALADRQQPLARKPALVGWVPTDDPNAGKVPSDVFENVDPQTGYLSPFDWDAEDSAWFEWAKPLIAVGTHLGGTHFYAQALPDDLTARYIEFDEFDVLNFGCGSAVFDFETGVFDWSCG